MPGARFLPDHSPEERDRIERTPAERELHRVDGSTEIAGATTVVWRPPVRRDGRARPAGAG